MYQTDITEREAGQRFDKYLHRMLPNAGNSFLYKMLRKKNITLNGKKADGSEKICVGDSVAIYFADDTLAKFMGREAANHEDTAALSGKTVSGGHEQGVSDGMAAGGRQNGKAPESDYASAYRKISGIRVLYENDHILIVDKPAGVLSQKAKRTDISLNEWLIGYLLHSGCLSEEELAMYKPSVCNRLDRNTSGIVLCAKSLQGAQLLGELLGNRTIHKYYQLYVRGRLQEEQLIEGYLRKDVKNNKVSVGRIREAGDTKDSGKRVWEKECYNGRNGNAHGADGALVRTKYKPLKIEGDKTLLEVELITGKPHQIRAHLAGIGHPLLGDYKYGDKAWNEAYRRKFQVTSQLLHAYKVEFPQLDPPFEDISGRTFYAGLPEIFARVADSSGSWVKDPAAK